MAQRYEYEASSHYDPPNTNQMFFKEQIKAGWRLAAITKVSKDNYVAYWEKPYNG